MWIIVLTGSIAPKRCLPLITFCGTTERKIFSGLIQKLLDLLFRISTKVNLSGPFHVISGYRSPTTNAMLRKKNKSVAKNSFHVKGQAIDIRLPGLYLSRLKKLAVKMNAGGVGYYPRSNFIHLDIGPVRYWVAPFFIVQGV